MSMTPVSSTTRFSVPNLLRRSGREVYRGLFSQPFSHLSSEKIVSIKYPPIILALMAGMGLIYSHGSEMAKPDGDRQGWLKSLIEAAASYGLVDNFGGVYPLWGMGVSAYRAGQKSTTLEKIQEGVKSAVVMSLGYLGIHLGASFSDAATEIEERKMHELLAHPSIEQWLNSDRIKNSPDETVQALAGHLREMREKTTRTYENHFTVNRNLAKTMKKEMADLSLAIHGNLQRVDRAAFLPIGKEAALRFDKFSKVLEYSQQGYIQLTRRLNPIFGYLMAGLVVGAPVASLLNQQIDKRFPKLSTMHVPPAMQSHLTKNINLSGGGHHGSPSEALPWVLPALGKEPASAGGGH